MKSKFILKDRIDKHLFKIVMTEGKSLHSPLLSLRLKRSAPDQKARFAAVVSKKSYKRAVDRNKLKRRARAIFRKLASSIPSGSYILFMKKGTLGLSFSDLERMIKALVNGSK